MNGHKTRMLFIVFIILKIGFAVSVDPGSPGSDGDQLYINYVVGDVIDAREARYYGIFSDIDGFVSAAFYSFEYSNDPAGVRRSTDTCSGYVVVKIIHTANYGAGGPDSGGAETSIEKHVRISRDAFRTLQDYLFYFWELIRDKRVREDFAKNHVIEWPLVTAEEMDASEKDARKYLLKNSTCCIGSLGAGGSYIGALAGTEMTYHSTSGCHGYYTYTVSPFAVYSSALAGAGLGCMMSNILYAKDAKTEALRHRIIAFDGYNIPITEDDIGAETSFESRTAISTAAGCLGITAAVGTGILLYAPWWDFFEDFRPETEADRLRTIVPVVAVSLAEFGIIMKIFWDLGEKRDRQAAIEGIKKKREEERFERWDR